MRLQKHAVIGLLTILLIGLIGTSSPAGISTPELKGDSPFASQTDQTPQEEDSIQSKAFTISADSDEGVLDPVRIRQSGYQTTDLSKGSADIGINSTGNIPIDEANGWFVNNTEIEVTDLKPLYGVNGTFDDGTDPWIPYSFDGGSNTQTNSYNSTGEYIVCQNTGSYNPGLGGSYLHSEDSEVGWEQVITNTPESLNFRLEFDFRYVSGPLDPDGDDSFAGDFGVFWQLDTEGYYYPLQDLSSRETWYSVSHDFTVDPGTSTFTIYVGLWIGWADMWIYVNTDYDDDPLGLPDGHENAENVTVYIDNVEFKGLTSPGFDVVDLTFHAGSLSAPITGMGIGIATITNPDYWTATPLDFQITANTSVAFTYSITTLFHRYINSSWTTDLSKEGVQYSVTAGQSPDLALFTYITPSTEYDGVTLDLFYPDDWENATVLDPLTIDITNNCSIFPGRIHVPNSEMSRSGWWEIDLQSPNYAQNVSIQVQDESTGQWSGNSLFRPGNTTRAQIEIGAAAGNPVDGSPVNITWLLPNSTAWAYDSISVMSSGIVNSSHWILGGANTSAGQWEVTALWVNGTEIAYDYSIFDMYHTATLTPREALVYTDTGLLITNMLYYVDDDTSEFIVDASATVVSNWSGPVIIFQENPIYNWWQADFDTSLVGEGQFIVSVNASMPYYEDTTCQFIIISTQRTNFQLTSVGPLPTEVGLHEEFTVQMRYELESSVGIDGATIQLNYTGPQGGLQLLGQSSTAPGDYSINITSSMAGTYTVTITGSKEYHYSNSDSFTLIVGDIDTVFNSINGTSDVTQLGVPYRLVVQYRNSTGYGLTGANVSVTDINPASGLIAGASVDEGNGYYSIVLTPSAAQTYTIFINANLTNHVTRIASFTITVNEIPTVLTADSSGTTLSVGETQSVELSFRDESSTGITGATISVLNQPAGLSFVIAELSGGLYNMSITALTPGTYQIAIKASMDNYINSTLGYTVIVRGIGTVFVSINGTYDMTQLGVPYRLVVQYRNSTGYGLTGANVSVTDISPASGLIAGASVDEGNGYYSIVLTPSAAQTFTIIINANMTDHISQVVSFTITVNEIPTVLTADSSGTTLSVGDSQSIELSFRDESSTGITGATISVLNLPAGLSIDMEELSGGQYNVTINAYAPGTYQIAFKASMDNYINSTLGYTVIVRGFTSNLVILNGTADFAFYGDIYRLVAQFTNGTSFGLISADVEVIDIIPVTGIAIEATVDEGNGYYSISLTAESAGIFSILLKANLTDYITQFISFGLTVREIPTILTLDDSGATISVDQSHVAQISFRDDTLTGLLGATVVVLSPPSGLGYSVAEVSDGHYTLTLTPTLIGTYEFAIRATLANYLNSTVGFTLVVRTIPTELRIIEGVSADSTYFTEDYNLTLVYVRTDTGLNISSADLAITTLPAEGLMVTITQMGNHYLLGFVADTIGKWQIFFTANKTDHVGGFIEFELEVLPVAIEIDNIQGLTEIEGTLTTLSFRLVESETRNPVSGATVEYQLISETGPGEIGLMVESGAGLYTATFQMPSFESTTDVRIYVTIENYEIASDYFEAELKPILSEVAALSRTIQFFSPYIAIIGIAVLGYASRRAYTRKQRKQNIDAMVVKRRFDDVKSLLGVIVLHKYTGIPIYSKMMKGGFDETLVSGFVSAISTFRAEFHVNQENWTVTPISDIIRTVGTDNLICAFISLSPPSKGQELRMVEFAEAIGFVFDSMYTEAPTRSLDEGTLIQFDAFFDDIMDGRFLRDYTVSEVKSFPRKTKCIEARIHRIDDEDGFDLDELATEMTSCGLEEARVYKIIMDAIEMGNLALATLDRSNVEVEDSVDMRPEMMMPAVETESDMPEPPPESDAMLEDLEADISEEERFLEDVEALLTESPDDKDDE